MQEVAIDLAVQIPSIRHHDKREIAGLLPKDLSHIKDHRKALAAALRMPEHTQLSIQLVTLAELFIRTVHTQKLVVLGHDLVVLAEVDDEVLDVVQQLGRIEQTINQAFQTGLVVGDAAGLSGGLNLVAVDLFRFVVGAKPLKEGRGTKSKTRSPKTPAPPP